MCVFLSLQLSGAFEKGGGFVALKLYLLFVYVCVDFICFLSDRYYYYCRSRRRGLISIIFISVVLFIYFLNFCYILLAGFCFGSSPENGERT